MMPSTSCLDKLLMAEHRDRKYLDILKGVMEEHSRRLILGEPDYIELYLKHYPIVNESYLLNGSDTVQDQVEQD